MVKRGDFDPQYFHKPSLHFYLRMPVVAASFLWSVKKGEIRAVREIKTRDPHGLAGYAFSASHPRIVKWNRTLSVAFAIGLVLLAGLIAFELTRNSAAAVVSTLIVAVSPALASASATIGVDMPMAFLCLLSAYLALLFYRTGAGSTLVWCAAAAGLAVSTKYNALPVMALPVVAVLCRRGFSSWQFWAALLVPVFAFFLGSPFILSSLPLFLDHFAYEIWHYGVAGHAGHSAAPGWEQLLHYGAWLRQDALGFVVLIAAIVGIVWMIVARSRAAAIVLLFPALFFALMVMQKTNFTRNMLVIVPFLAVFAGIALAGLGLSNSRSSRAKKIVLALIVLLGLLAPFRDLLTLRAVAKSSPESRVALTQKLAELGAESEIGVDGSLQLASDHFQRRGLAVLSSSLADGAPDLFRAFLDGFDYLVVPSRIVTADLLRITSKQFELGGSQERQRIVKNPAITALKVPEWSEEEQLVWLTELEKRISEIPVYTLRSTKLGSECIASVELIDQGLELSYCWVNSRIARIKFEQLPGQKELSMQIMTPWPRQEITFFGDEWSHSLAVPQSGVGTWIDVTLQPPERVLREGAFMRITQVRSPFTQQMSEDKRRLGVAIRNGVSPQ